MQIQAIKFYISKDHETRRYNLEGENHRGSALRKSAYIYPSHICFKKTQFTPWASVNDNYLRIKCLNIKLLFREFAVVEQEVFGGSVREQEPVGEIFEQQI